MENEIDVLQSVLEAVTNIAMNNVSSYQNMNTTTTGTTRLFGG